MNQITVKGVVLSSMPISEYDKRLVILTRERGKITAFARGARRQNSQYLAGSQPMTFGEFTVYQGRNAYTLTGIKVTKYFADDMTDLDKMSYGMYFLEVSDYFGREGLESGETVNLVFLAIKALLNEAIPDALVRRIFELRTLVINGEYPNLFACTRCGSEVELEAYDRYGEGMVCHKCRYADRRFISIDQSTLYALQYIITAPLQKLFTFNVTDEVRERMTQIISLNFEKAVDREFKSLDFIFE